MDLEQQQLAVATGIGELLAAARVKSGLSVMEVADQLHLKQSFVIALEKADYQMIGSMVYVKGYLRTYARLMQVDIEQELLILQSNKASLTMTAPRCAPILTKPKTKWHKLFEKNRWLILVIFAAIVVYYFWPTPAVVPAATAPVIVGETPKIPPLPAPTAVLPPVKITTTVPKQPSAAAMSMTRSDNSHSDSQNDNNDD